MAKIELIEPSVALFEQKDVLSHIEVCGRVCYKSEDRIAEGTALKFVNMLANRGHTAMLEHGTAYLIYSSKDLEEDINYQVLNSKYSSWNHVGEWFYVTTNFRVLFETIQKFDFNSPKLSSQQLVQEALQHIQDFGSEGCTEHHEKRYTLRFICDRGVSHELVRHRVFSFAQESTRYVNYGNKGFLFIKPAWWEDKFGAKGNLSMEHTVFIAACESSADNYETLSKLGQTPQQARAVLPNSLKTEVVMTGTESQWRGFFVLRDDVAAHPDMQRVAKMARIILCTEDSSFA